MLSSHQRFGDSLGWRKKNPPFVSLNTSVPRTCGERVLVHLAARSLGANQEPAVRRRSTLAKLQTCFRVYTYQLSEKIFCQNTGRLIVVHHDFSFGVLLQACFKHVERAVISVIKRVLYVFLQRHFEFATSVRLSTLEHA